MSAISIWCPSGTCSLSHSYVPICAPHTSPRARCVRCRHAAHMLFTSSFTCLCVSQSRLLFLSLPHPESNPNSYSKRNPIQLIATTWRSYPCNRIFETAAIRSAPVSDAINVMRARAPGQNSCRHAPHQGHQLASIKGTPGTRNHPTHAHWLLPCALTRASNVGAQAGSDHSWLHKACRAVGKQRTPPQVAWLFVAFD